MALVLVIILAKLGSKMFFVQLGFVSCPHMYRKYHLIFKLHYIKHGLWKVLCILCFLFCTLEKEDLKRMSVVVSWGNGWNEMFALTFHWQYSISLYICVWLCVCVCLYVCMYMYIYYLYMYIYIYIIHNKYNVDWHKKYKLWHNYSSF